MLFCCKTLPGLRRLNATGCVHTRVLAARASPRLKHCRKFDTFGSSVEISTGEWRGSIRSGDKVYLWARRSRLWPWCIAAFGLTVENYSRLTLNAASVRHRARNGYYVNFGITKARKGQSNDEDRQAADRRKTPVLCKQIYEIWHHAGRVRRHTQRSGWALRNLQEPGLSCRQVGD